MKTFQAIAAICIMSAAACSKPSPGTPVTITINPVKDPLMKTPILFSVSVYPDVESYQWDFGDGTTSTLAAPSHSYQDMGTYYVSCTAYRLGVAHAASLKLFIKGDPRLTPPRHFTGTSIYYNSFQNPASVTRNITDTVISFVWSSPFILNGMNWSHDAGTEVQYQTYGYQQVNEYLRYYPAIDSIYLSISVTNSPGVSSTNYALVNKK